MSEDQNQQIKLEAYRVAKSTRDLEINLFWQRSNYFLVLSTAVAFGFFSLNLTPLAYIYKLNVI